MTVKQIFSLIGGGFVALLFAILGIQRKTIKKQKAKVKEAEQEAQSAELKLKIGETASKAKDDILAGQKERKEQKDEVDRKITESSKKEDPHEKRETQQQIINDINDLFNKRNTAK